MTRCEVARAMIRCDAVRIDGLTYIGKESNRLEEVESGAVHDPDAAYTEYPDPRLHEWTTKILPGLKKMKLAELVQRVPEMSRRALIDIRAGRSRPHPRNEKLLRDIFCVCVSKGADMQSAQKCSK